METEYQCQENFTKPFPLWREELHVGGENGIRCIATDEASKLDVKLEDVLGKGRP